MEAQYWLDRWRDGRIGFHEGAPNPWLAEHVAMLGPGEGRRVLVPLCGKSVDLAFLAAHGFEVVGVELSEAAAAAFFEEAGLAPTRREEPGFVRLGASSIEIVVGDFFALDVADVGLFDAFYDRAAVVALPPTMRAPYAEKLCSLLSADARGLVVTFEHDGPSGTPPFSVTADEVARLWPGFERVALGRTDLVDPSSALRKAGATFVIEAAYAMRRTP